MGFFDWFLKKKNKVNENSEKSEDLKSDKTNNTENLDPAEAVIFSNKEINNVNDIKKSVNTQDDAEKNIFQDSSLNENTIKNSNFNKNTNTNENLGSEDILLTRNSNFFNQEKKIPGFVKKKDENEKINNSFFELNNKSENLNINNNSYSNNQNKSNNRKIMPSFSNFDKNLNIKKNNDDDLNLNTKNSENFSMNNKNKENLEKISLNEKNSSYKIPFPENLGNEHSNNNFNDSVDIDLGVTEKNFVKNNLNKITDYKNNNYKKNDNLEKSNLNESNKIEDSFFELNNKSEVIKKINEKKENLEEIKKPIKTEKDLFMSILDFKNLYGIIDSINQDVEIISSSTLRTIEINNDLDLNYQRWKNDFSEMNKNLEQFEKIFFN
ncbi:MAG: hypothetical protein ACOC3X_00405 [Nanoarchaeota archaeon]